MLNTKQSSFTHFRDKVVVITGAASGIGKALAEELVESQAQVILVDWNAKLLQETEAYFKSRGGKVCAWEINVSNLADVQEMISSAIAQYQRIDYLFNNAGIGIAGEVRDFSIEDWREVIDVNLGGV
ncbi:MAG: SDR family oxidoreductase, partial [Synechococcales bacterium]|nr:SDR family oxidoreductase [Synechococcales bacterium]